MSIKDASFECMVQCYLPLLDDSEGALQSVHSKWAVLNSINTESAWLTEVPGKGLNGTRCSFNMYFLKFAATHLKRTFCTSLSYLFFPPWSTDWEHKVIKAQTRPNTLQQNILDQNLWPWKLQCVWISLLIHLLGLHERGFETERNPPLNCYSHIRESLESLYMLLISSFYIGI